MLRRLRGFQYSLIRLRNRTWKEFRRKVFWCREKPIDPFAAYRELERMLPRIGKRDWTGWDP